MRRTPAAIARLRDRLAEEAARQIGKPYVYGARWQDAPERFDCSSLVQYLYKTVGIVIPRVTIDQAREGRRVRPLAPSMKVGDLIFLRGKTGRYDRRFPQGIGHVVMVVGPDAVVHARSCTVRGKERGCVVRQPLAKFLRRKDITVVKRLL